ncbi:hypothetical protein CL630_02025 [bacterium]|nr:hypothetical protein [bacterium]
MFKIIEKVQQKSEHTRKLVALSVSVFVTFIIAAIWVSTLDEQLSTQQGGTPMSLLEQDNLAPLTLVKDQFKQLYSVFTNNRPW